MLLQKIIHSCVVSFFALVGVLNLLYGVGYVRRPWTTPQVKYYSGEMTVLEGILFLGVALGIFRFNSRVRIIAIIIAALSLSAYGAVTVVMPGVAPAVLSLVWLLVLVWLFYPTVRAKFVVGKHAQKMA
jgi:hypothetical protein